MKIGITAGCPAGIGPEIVAKSLQHLTGSLDKFTVYCDLEDFRSIWKMVNYSEIPDDLEIHDVGHFPFKYGEAGIGAGTVAYRSIERAVRDALDGRIDGIATAPINKESFKMAGSKFIDHTTMIKSLSSSSWLETIFETGSLRVSFLTKHIPFREIIDHINENEIYNSIKRGDLSLRLLGSRKRRIAIAALNPHAGDGGIMGDEEERFISPAVEHARSDGVEVTGPVPADSVFHRAISGEFDLVISLYHD
ncbi:MAG: 4-hydroxythreonine-4-phosphate dehydrogenase PdxA, partial [Thermoplasmataceae archaeon]